MRVLLLIIGLAIVATSLVAQDKETIAFNVTPKLGVKFGTVVTATISKAESRQLAGGGVPVDEEWTLTLTDTSAPTSRLEIANRDIVLYNTRGHLLRDNCLRSMIGARVKLFEGGGFQGIPNGLWDGDAPIKSRGVFEFRPVFTILVADEGKGSGVKILETKESGK